MIRLDVTEAMIDYSKNHIIQWLDLNVGRYSGIEQYRNAKIYHAGLGWNLTPNFERDALDNLVITWQLTFDRDVDATLFRLRWG